MFKIKKPNLQTHIEISFETVEKKKMTKVSKKLVVYMCIIFESMHSIFALPGWRHKCILKKRGLVISDWYFGEGMETNSAGEKVKKERKDKILFKNYVYTQ